MERPRANHCPGDGAGRQESLAIERLGFPELRQVLINGPVEDRYSPLRDCCEQDRERGNTEGFPNTVPPPNLLAGPLRVMPGRGAGASDFGPQQSATASLIGSSAAPALTPPQGR